MDAVRRGWLNAALVPGVSLVEPGGGADLTLDSAVIVREPVWLAVPRGHPMSEEPALDTCRLASLDWVRYARNHWFHPIEKLLFVRLPRRRTRWADRPSTGAAIWRCHPPSW